jgi:hypothetical protein
VVDRGVRDHRRRAPAGGPAGQVLVSQLTGFRWCDTLSLEEISDRLEIQQLLVAYSTAIDQRRFDDLDASVTRDSAKSVP